MREDGKTATVWFNGPSARDLYHVKRQPLEIGCNFIEQHRPATAAAASSSSSSEEPSPPADATEELPSVSPDSIELYSEAAASDEAQTASTEHLAEEATAEAAALFGATAIRACDVSPRHQ